MKLDHHPASTTSRPVELFATAARIASLERSPLVAV